MLKKIYLLAAFFAAGEASAAINESPRVKAVMREANIPNTPAMKTAIVIGAAVLWPLGAVVNGYRHFRS